MSKPLILYQNVLTETNVTASSSEAGFPAAAVASPFTYPADSWAFFADDEVTLDIDAGAPVAADSVGLLCYNLTDSDIVFQYSDDGVSYTDLHAFAANRDGAYFFHDSVTHTHRYWRLSFRSFSADIGAEVQVPVVYIGEALQFEYCIMKKHAPLPYNRNTEYLTNESGTGQYLGRSVIRLNYETSVSFNLMSAAWVRQYFQPFVEHCQEGGAYFFAWNYGTYPDEVGYVWTEQDIGVDYTGDRDKMASSWNMRGLV